MECVLTFHPSEETYLMERYFSKNQVCVFHSNDEYKQNRYVVWCMSVCLMHTDWDHVKPNYIGLEEEKNYKNERITYKRKTLIYCLFLRC